MARSPISKDTLRRIAMQRRNELTAAEQQQAAARMMVNFMQAVALQKSHIIGAYWPIRGEMNAIPLLSHLAREGYACALPVVTGAHDPLQFRSWSPQTPMRAGIFANIPEPDAAFSDIVLPDVLIMPLTAFDDKGHRVGYGAGHYDRTIEALGAVKPVFKVGVCYSFQQFDNVPSDPHDIALDMVVTDDAVHKF